MSQAGLSPAPPILLELHAGLLRLLSHPASGLLRSLVIISSGIMVSFRLGVAAIAWQLQSRGLVEERVGIHLPRSADLLATIVACLRLGLPYVPLDRFPQRPGCNK